MRTRSSTGRFAKEGAATLRFQVERILRRDESAAVLAKEMGCSKSNIYYIRSGKGWRHVNAPRQLGQALDDLRIIFAGSAA